MASDTDDSWAEFYREIGLEPETPAAPPVALEDEPEPTAEADAGESEGDDDDEGGEESTEADGPAGEEELNEDGTKKKRRRRRRRSKRKGPGPLGEAGGEGEGTEFAEAEEPLAEVYADDGGPSPEASRELIANWDVPSWTDIVAGLHRPTGR